MLNDEEIRIEGIISFVTEHKVDEHAALLRLTDGGSCFDLKHAFGVWVEKIQSNLSRIRASQDNVEAHQTRHFIS